MTLEPALRLNAAFSFATGFVLTLAPATVGTWLDVSITGWLRFLGIALVAHGGLLLWASRQSSIISLAKLNVAAIGPYPLIMIALVVTGLVDSTVGRTLLLLDGAVVWLLAIAQWTGLRAGKVEAHPVSV